MVKTVIYLLLSISRMKPSLTVTFYKEPALYLSKVTLENYSFSYLLLFELSQNEFSFQKSNSEYHS